MAGKTAEVIDVLNDDTECYLFYNGHNTEIYGSSGGRIKDDIVLCGGGFRRYPNSYWGNYYNYDYVYQCLILGKEGSPIMNPWLASNLTLTVPRYTFNGGVILPNNTLFISGTYNFISKEFHMIVV